MHAACVRSIRAALDPKWASGMGDGRGGAATVEWERSECDTHDTDSDSIARPTRELSRNALLNQRSHTRLALADDDAGDDGTGATVDPRTACTASTPIARSRL